MLSFGWVTLLCLVPFGGTLECYDSSLPFPDRTETCQEPNMMCYSEFYVVNRSGTLRDYHDRFCAHEKHCFDRNIHGCRTLDELAPSVQKAFIKYHVKSVPRRDIVVSKFCCCKDDLCNMASMASPVFLSLLVLCVSL